MENSIVELKAFQMVRGHLQSLTDEKIHDLNELISPYCEFRRKVAWFHKRYLSGICTEKCFMDRTSFCCNRDGIATFFADVVVNCLIAGENDLNNLEERLKNDPGGFKCIYLTDKGCLWKMKPIVCEMFLCDHAKNKLKEAGDQLMEEWNMLCVWEKDFTWPDKQVLFDDIEALFLQAGYESPIMYFHKSPGLLRVKKKRDNPSGNDNKIN